MATTDAKLIEALSDIDDRRAHYYCVLVLLRRADDAEPLIADGMWWGTIADEPRGSGGFGYDPHFRDAQTGMSGAEMPLEMKNALSHRGKAMRALIDRLNEVRSHAN